MKLGIMQPYFFPYLGYFSLINYVDKWVVFDPVQYMRKGWINRNRVIKMGGGDKYIGITVEKHHQQTLIKDIKINTSLDWKGQIIRNLDYYKKIAPYYNETIELLNSCFEFEGDSIVNFNAFCLEKTCNYLSIPFEYEIYSEMEINHNPAGHPGEWALWISKALGASEYVNPSGGRDIFNKNQFEENGIELKFLDSIIEPYNQGGIEFLPSLSILDIMFFNDKETINVMLNKFKLSDE